MKTRLLNVFAIISLIFLLVSCSASNHYNELENAIEVSIKDVIFEDKTVYFDDQSHSIEATNIPQGVLVDYSNNNQTAKGEYIVKAIFSAEKGYKIVGDNKLVALLKIMNKPLDIKYMVFESMTVEQINCIKLDEAIQNELDVFSSFLNNYNIKLESYDILYNPTDYIKYDIDYEKELLKTVTIKNIVYSGDSNYIDQLLNEYVINCYWYYDINVFAQDIGIYENFSKFIPANEYKPMAVGYISEIKVKFN
ncbi:MAG: hypothetical protein ACRC5M_01155 [Anaeroplasmataceae bacterium]